MITKNCPKCGDPMSYPEDATQVTCPTCHSTYNIRTKQAAQENHSAAPSKPHNVTSPAFHPILKCPSCGSPVVSRDTYYVCSHCASKIALDGTVVNRPQAQYQEQVPRETDDSSYGLGFILGFFLGLIGLIIGLAIGKPNIKRGSVHGFVSSLILGVVAGIILWVTVLGSVALL